MPHAASQRAGRGDCPVLAAPLVATVAGCTIATLTGEQLGSAGQTRQTASEAVTAGAQRTASDWRIAKTLVRSSREGPDRQGLERHGPCPRAPVRGRIFSQILLRLYSAILAQASPGLIEPGRTAASMMVRMPHLASSGLSPAWL